MATQMLLRVKVALAGASRTGGVGRGELVVLRVVGMEVTLWPGARIIRGMIVVCVCACVCVCARVRVFVVRGGIGCRLVYVRVR